MQSQIKVPDRAARSPFEVIIDAPLVSFAVTLQLILLLGVLISRALVGDPELALPALAIARFTLISLLFNVVIIGTRVDVAIPLLVGLVIATIGLPALSLSFVLDAIVLAGLALFALSGLGRINRHLKYWQTILAAILTGCFTTLYSLGWNGANALILENTLAGLAHVDTLYHASIAQSLLGTGTTSIGLDGASNAPYHVFSHRMVAGLAHWTGLLPVQAYGLFLPLIGYPLLFVTLLRLWRALHAARDQELSFILPLAAILGLGLLDWRSYLASESYLIALVLAFLAIWWIAKGRSPRKWVGLALLVALTALAKISVGAILGCVVAFAFFIERPSLKLALGGACLGIAPFVITLLVDPVAPVSEGSILRPLAYLRSYPTQAAYHILWSAIATWAAWSAFPADRKSARIVLVLLVGVWAALVSSLLVDVPAGAAYYFGNPGIWFGVFILAATGWIPSPLRAISPQARRALCWIILTAGVLNHDTLSTWPQSFAKTRLSIETAAQQPLEERPMGRVYLALQDPDYEGVFVTPDMAAIWEDRHFCWGASLTVRALSHAPLLLGLPPQACELSPYYGFQDYDPAISRSRPISDDQELCGLANTRNMNRVLILSPDTPRVVDCQGE